MTAAATLRCTRLSGLELLLDGLLLLLRRAR
jgi:hypothetical protein